MRFTSLAVLAACSCHTGAGGANGQAADAQAVAPADANSSASDADTADAAAAARSASVQHEGARVSDWMATNHFDAATPQACLIMLGPHRRLGRAHVKITGASPLDGSYEAVCGAANDEGQGYSFAVCESPPGRGFGSLVMVEGDTFVPGRPIAPQVAKSSAAPTAEKGAPGSVVTGGKDFFSAKVHLVLPTDAGTVGVDAEFACAP